MSYANTLVGNNYRPDRKLLEALTSLTAQLAALKARADTLPATSGVSMGSLGACGLLGMCDGRPSFEVDTRAVEITYSVGARTETLSRVTANASGGVFISVYDGMTLLGGAGKWSAPTKFRCRGPSESANRRRVGWAWRSRRGYRADMGLIYVSRLFCGLS